LEGGDLVASQVTQKSGEMSEGKYDASLARSIGRSLVASPVSSPASTLTVMRAVGSTGRLRSRLLVLRM
jgi:hypothetical protein